MPHDPEAFAAMVVSTVKAAMAPAFERIAVLEQANKDLALRLAEAVALRDKVVALETKSVPEPPRVDLTPLVERVAAAETRLSVLGDLRDRVVTLETKQAIPAPVIDLSSLHGEFAATKSAISAVSERVAVVETRQPVPGPAGPAGKDGTIGRDGKDGADGMGWDDLSVEHDGERTFTFKLFRGDRAKEIGKFKLPIPLYRGIWGEGRTAEQGDLFTYAKGIWYCIKDTVIKPDATGIDSQTGEFRGAQGKDFWKLAVKGGQDGRDGKDAPSLPVVPVRRP